MKPGFPTFGNWLLAALLSGGFPLLLIGGDAGSETENSSPEIASDPMADIAELKQFKARVAADPEDGEAHAGMGRLFGNLGSHEMALGAFRRAEELGVTTPEFHLAFAETLLELSHFEESVSAYQAAIQAGSDSSKARTGMAVAYMAMRRAGEAGKQLERATELEPEAEPTHRLLKAQALAMAGNDNQAAVELAAVNGLDPDDDQFFDFFHGRIEDAIRPDWATGDWGYRLDLSVGYNDNVSLRPDQAAGVLAQELSDEPDITFGQALSLWGRPIGDSSSGVVIQGNLSGIQNADQSEFNQFYASGGAIGYHTFNPDWRGEIGTDFLYGAIDGDDYAFVGSAHTRVTWQQEDWTRTGLRYRFSYRDYRFPVLPEENRDGPLHVFDLSQDVFVPCGNRLVQLTPFAAFGIEDAQGDSSKNDYWGAGLRARVPLTPWLEAFGTAAYVDRSYENPHIRSLFTAPREDQQWNFGAGLRARLTRQTSMSLGWQHLKNDSNIPGFFGYSQDAFVLGVSIEGP